MSNIRLNNAYGVSTVVSLNLPTTIDENPVTELSGFQLMPGKAGQRSYTYVKGDSIKKLHFQAFASTRISIADLRLSTKFVAYNE